MIKRAAVLLVGAGCFLGAAAVSATPYDDCIKDFAKQGPTGDYEYSVCMKQEAARLLTEIQKVYTKNIKRKVTIKSVRSIIIERK